MSRTSVGLFAILLLTGEIAPSQMQEAVSPPRRHIIEIRDFDFHPKRTLALPGDTVVWINRDIVPHTATANDRGWSSQALEEGESWEMVVKDTRLHNYFCDFHRHMEGVLETRHRINRQAKSARVTQNPR